MATNKSHASLITQSHASYIKSIAHCTHYIWHTSHIARNTRDTYHTLHVSHSTLSTRGYRLTTFNSLALGIHVRRVVRPVLSPKLSPPSAFYAGYTFNEIYLRFLFFLKYRLQVASLCYTSNVHRKQWRSGFWREQKRVDVWTIMRKRLWNGWKRSRTKRSLLLSIMNHRIKSRR